MKDRRDSCPPRPLEPYFLHGTPPICKRGQYNQSSWELDSATCARRSGQLCCGAARAFKLVSKHVWSFCRVPGTTPELGKIQACLQSARSFFFPPWPQMPQLREVSYRPHLYFGAPTMSLMFLPFGLTITFSVNGQGANPDSQDAADSSGLWPSLPVPCMGHCSWPRSPVYWAWAEGLRLAKDKVLGAVGTSNLGCLALGPNPTLSPLLTFLAPC